MLVRLVEGVRVVTFPFVLLDLRCSEPEQEEVFGAHFFPDLDIRAVQRSNCDGAIHGKLHVSGSRSFLACQRNLLRQIGCGIDALAKLDTEVREKDYLKSS